MSNSVCVAVSMYFKGNPTALFFRIGYHRGCQPVGGHQHRSRGCEHQLIQRHSLEGFINTS